MSKMSKKNITQRTETFLSINSGFYLCFLIITIIIKVVLGILRWPSSCSADWEVGRKGKYEFTVGRGKIMFLCSVFLLYLFFLNILFLKKKLKNKKIYIYLQFWQLADTYLPYALGGGYVIASPLVKFVVQSQHLLKHFNSEVK